MAAKSVLLQPGNLLSLSYRRQLAYVPAALSLPKLHVSLSKAASPFTVFAGRSHYGRFPASPLCLPNPEPPWLAEARKGVARQSLPLEEQLHKLDVNANNSEERKEENYETHLRIKALKQECKREYGSLWAIIARHEEFGAAFELEAEAQGYLKIRRNVFKVEAMHESEKEQEAMWSRLAGLRLIMEPLLVAPTPQDLVAQAMDLRLDLVQDSFSIRHEKLERNEGAIELNQVVLRRHLGVVLGNPLWAACKDEPSPTRPRYVVLEMTEGYALGYVVYAPPLLGPDYSSAPQTWSAALPPELAAVAVNLVAKPGQTLLDPCCGSGTILFEAHRRGVHAIGSDVNSTILRMAAANFKHFGVPYEAASDVFSKDAYGNIAGRRTWKARDESRQDGTVSERETCPVNSKERSVLQDSRLNKKSCENEQLQRTQAIQLSIQDAQTVSANVDCLVTNLPYNRFLEVSESEIDMLVRNLRSCAREFVFFAGAPLHSTLEQAGYEVIVEIDIGDRGKRYMSWARSSFIDEPSQN